jgi:hypothetical protein
MEATELVTRIATILGENSSHDWVNEAAKEIRIELSCYVSEGKKLDEVWKKAYAEGAANIPHRKMTFWEREVAAAKELALPIGFLPLIIVTIRNAYRRFRARNV